MKNFDKNHIAKPIYGKKRKQLLEHHFYTAKRMALAFKKINELIYNDDLKNIPRVRLQKRLFTIKEILQSPKCLLDDHYHHLISNSEFMDWGHIYYNQDGKKESRRSDPLSLSPEALSTMRLKKGEK